MIARYLGLALRVMVRASAALQPKTAASCVRKDWASSVHMPMGMPKYFMRDRLLEVCQM